ncbi:MAG: hypothetical protein IKE24_06655 [Clostridia bacterium]|nr:hypothetical protein [Clostridia bacterium]
MIGNRKWKKLLGGMLAAVLLLVSAAATASTGDRTLLQTNSETFSEYVERLMIIGTRVYMATSGTTQAIYVYDTRTGQTETFDTTAMNDRLHGLGDEPMLTEDGERYTEEIACWFAWRGEIYAVVYRNINFEDGSDIDGGYVRKLVLADGQASLEETELPQLEWRGMVERNGANRFSRWITGSVCTGEHLALSVYGDSGDMELHIFDLEEGDEETAEIDNLEDVGQGPDGKLLVARIDRRGDSHLIIETYDIEEETTETLAEFEGEYTYNIRGIAWREENRTLYYVTNGEIFAAREGDTENAESVNDCGIVPSSMFAQMTEDGFLAVYRYDGAVIRNTDPSQRGAVTIRIQPFTWSSGANAAYYAFTNERGDISVIREENGDMSTLLQSMMNQDDRIDLYTIDSSSSVYSAIYNRGFMGSLEGSEKIRNLIGQMYPFIQEACQKDGQLVAIPISMYGDAFGYHKEAWSKLGYTDADLPRTWDQYMDLLETLPDKLEGTEYRLFELWLTKQGFRGALMSAIIRKYALTRPDDNFNTPVLQRLLERASKLDLDGLGLIDDEEEEDIFERYTELGGEKPAVLITGFEVPITNYRQEYQTLPLAFEEDEEPVLTVSLGVAFLNPYSKHPEEATAYLETMLENLDTSTAYSFCPDRNEPQRYPDHEEQKKNISRWADEARKSLEETEDEETREQLERSLEAIEKELAEFDEKNWMISPDAIANYRSRAPLIRMDSYDFWSMLYGGENGETFGTLWSGFLEGQKSVQDVLTYMDQKIRMMRMEGN